MEEKQCVFHIGSMRFAQRNNNNGKIKNGRENPSVFEFSTKSD